MKNDPLSEAQVAPSFPTRSSLHRLQELALRSKAPQHVTASLGSLMLYAETEVRPLCQLSADSVQVSAFWPGPNHVKAGQ